MGMRVMTILGTRPELIRLSLVIKKLDRLADQHTLVHTGQNYDVSLRDIFFSELSIRQPDYNLTIRQHTFGAQLGVIFTQVEQIILEKHPDAILVLGDTNSALCALLGARMQIPVFHMEAGNRCYDMEVPEETNRKIIDAISHYNLPYTQSSRENLIREGMASQRIWVSGNPIFEVLQHYQEKIDASDIHLQLGLQAGAYILVTAHRAENVDNPERLQSIITALDNISTEWKMPVIVSVHPRTRERMKNFDISIDRPNLRFVHPFGFFDFIKLQKHASCVLTDSGTVQEESCIFQIPAVTMRQSTERPETVLCGSNLMAGVITSHIVECTRLAMQSQRNWPLPEGYADANVSTKVVNYILGGLTYV